MSVRYRQLVAEDIAEAMQFKDLAGWNQTATDWRRFLSASPHGCFAAESEGRLVGTSATIVYEGRFAWIGMVIVATEHRGKGIGTELLQRAIRHLDGQQIPCIKLDATPQGKPLYEKFGFVSEYCVERWMLKRTPGRTSARAARAVSQEDLGLALQVDHDLFGADRSALLKSIVAESPHLTLIARRGKEVAGYAFGRPGSFADQMGTWMARDGDTATSLLDEFLRRTSRDLAFVDCVCDNAWAIPLVKNRGFEFSRGLTRMFRGGNLHPGKPRALCAIVGPEFG